MAAVRNSKSILLNLSKIEKILKELEKSKRFQLTSCDPQGRKK